RRRPAAARAIAAPARTLPAIVALAALGLLLLLPSARAANNHVVWSATTHPNNFSFDATAGKQLTFTLTAASSLPGGRLVIEPVSGLPSGASIGSTSHGKRATATFSWLPSTIGEYSLAFVAKGGGATAPVRTYVIHVNPRFPYSYRLTDDK